VGVWHHTAVVIMAVSLVSVYTDGRMVYQVRLKGRSFRESDRLYQLRLGSPHGLPVALDEVAIFNRPLLAEEIAEYVRALRQMHRIGYPSPPEARKARVGRDRDWQVRI